MQNSQTVEIEIERIIHKMQSCANLHEIWQIALEAVTNLGFDQVLFAKKRHFDDEKVENHADLQLFTNFGEALRDFYVEARSYREDLIIRKLQEQGGAFSWGITRELYLSGALGERAAFIHEKTRELGSKVGYSYGFGPHKSGVAGFAVSIFECDDQGWADELWHKNSKKIIVIMAVFDMALTRYAKNDTDMLSEIQLSILSLLADGKLNADIAEILNVHRRTVENHLLAIRKTLGADTTSEALFRATSQGML